MLTLEIITPDEKVLSTEANQVVLPTESGEAGILTGHIPMVTKRRGAVTDIRTATKAICLNVGGTLQMESVPHLAAGWEDTVLGIPAALPAVGKENPLPTRSAPLACTPNLVPTSTTLIAIPMPM